MGEAIRNIARRKVRSGLTIFGIVIGTFALTVMGGMTENFSRQIDGAIRIVGNTIDVESKKQINLTTVRRIERVEGVQAVVRSLGSTLVEDEDEESPGITFGPPNTVFGIAPQHDTIFFKGVRLQDGRWLERGDTYRTVLGANVAANKQVGVGDTIIWRKKKLTVIGVMESTQTFPDNFAVVPFETVRRVMRIPLWAVGSIAVIPESPQITEEVAERITKQVPGVTAESPERQIADIRQAMAIFQAIVLSGSLLAAIVGGLSVVNTMIMSVRERTREIGLKKAVGASDRAIVGEYLLEAAMMGLLGGIVGIVLGSILAQVLNAAFAEALSGAPLFVVTPRLVALTMTFAVAIGGVAGLYPAWSASRLDPVQALRST